jgi:hypothetical protein
MPFRALGLTLGFWQLSGSSQRILWLWGNGGMIFPSAVRSKKEALEDRVAGLWGPALRYWGAKGSTDLRKARAGKSPVNSDSFASAFEAAKSFL